MTGFKSTCIYCLSFSFLLVCASCDNEVADSENPIVIQKKSTAFEPVVYPNVKYNLGTKSFEDLLTEVLDKNGDPDLLELNDKLLKCKRKFETDSNVAAFTAALNILAEVYATEKAKWNNAETLLASEVLYQSARSFFYERTEVFTPTIQILDEAMIGTKKLIYSKDTLVQQTALFQLARLYDVMEGLSNMYSQQIAQLPENDHFFLSKNSLYIKRKVLGLKGGPIIRSLSNYLLDISAYNYSKNETQLTNAIDSIYIEAHEQIRYVDINQSDKYGEFIGNALRGSANYATKVGDYKMAQKLIEEYVSFITGVESYKLGAPVPAFEQSDKVSHHMSFVLTVLNRFIDATGSRECKATYQDLSEKLLDFAKIRFRDGSYRNDWAYYNISDLQNHKTGFGRTGNLSELDEPDLTRYFEEFLSIYNYQSNEFKAKQKLFGQNESYKTLFKELYLSESRLREAELLLRDNITSANLRKCSDAFLRFRELQKQTNVLISDEVFEQSPVDLARIRNGLEENEIWIAFFKRAKYAGGFNIFCVSKTDIKAKSVDLANLNGKMSEKGYTLNDLENVIVKNEPWNAEYDAFLSDLSNQLFEGFLPEQMENVILSDIGLKTTRLWEVFFRAYDKKRGNQLKSIRYANAILDSERHEREIRKFDWLAIAPQFDGIHETIDPLKRQKMVAELTPREDDGATAFSKLRAADDRLNPWETINNNPTPRALSYNTDEVQKINRDMHGIVLIGDEANEENFKAQLAGKSIIHIASHGFINENDIYRSGILLGNRHAKRGTEDNILYAYEIRTMDLDAELVVLSACETGISPIRYTRFDRSLSRAFIEAGCRNTVTGLWNVDDKSTHDIIIEFYKQLQSGKGKAEALFSAKNTYLKNNPNAHPHYWMPLILTGDNKPIILK